MDRTYVTQQHKTPVFQLGLDLWRDHVVHHPVIQQVGGGWGVWGWRGQHPVIQHVGGGVV
jgi:hypothetical protein